MHREDFLSQVRTDTRAYGRREASRITRGVLTALSGVLPSPAFHDLVEQLPPEVSAGPWPAVTVAPGDLLRQVARTLGVDGPEAAFLTRQVLGRLNLWCRGVTPAALAPGLDPALRPLLTGRPIEPMGRFTRHLAALSNTLPLLAEPPRAAEPAAEAATVTRHVSAPASGKSRVSAS